MEENNSLKYEENNSLKYEENNSRYEYLQKFHT